MLKLSSGMTVTGLRANMTSPTVPSHASLPPTNAAINTTKSNSPSTVLLNPSNIGATPTTPSSLIMAHQQHIRRIQHPQQVLSKTTVSRLSNFSVASLLADTRPRTPTQASLNMIVSGETNSDLIMTNFATTPSGAISPLSHDSSSSPASPIHTNNSAITTHQSSQNNHPQFHPVTVAHHAQLLQAAQVAAAHAHQQHAVAIAAAAAASGHLASHHHHLPVHLRHPLNATVCQSTGSIVINTASSSATSENTVNPIIGITPSRSINNCITQVETSTVNNNLTNLSTRSSIGSPPSAKAERHSPIDSSIDSELDYDDDANEHNLIENDGGEDSIVDIEDMNNEGSPGSSTPDNLDMSKSLELPSSLTNSPHLLSTAALAATAHVPIRPTPFSALAAAAVAWGGIGNTGVPWPGPRQISPFGPPSLFSGQPFTPGGK